MTRLQCPEPVCGFTLILDPTEVFAAPQSTPQPNRLKPGTHTSRVVSAVFSPDGQRTVTTSDDETARVFRVVTLSEIVDLLAQ